MDALIALQLEGFRQILSPQMPARYLMRQIGMSWYRMMEEVFHDTPVGTRILVRRERVFSSVLNDHVVHEYITTRQALPTFLGDCWTHQDVAYREGEMSPYPYDIDAFTQRDEILNNHRNNLNINPMEEGQEDMMDISPPHLFPPLPAPQAFPLSSSALLSSYQP